MCIHASSTEVLNVNCSSADNIKFNDDAIVNGSLEYHTVALNITHPVLNTEEGYLYGVTYTGKTLTLFSLSIQNNDLIVKYKSHKSKISLKNI